MAERLLNELFPQLRRMFCAWLVVAQAYGRNSRIWDAGHPVATAEQLDKFITTGESPSQKPT
jgi:hypothetical protein